MKTLRFIFTLVITLALGISLNTRLGGAPPLGKFLSPFQGFWQNAEEEGVNYAEEINLKGISKPVKIYYDEIRIPHIYADNDEDLHMVQGYLTARDRLWQMDFFSRLVLGRLSEVVGELALSTDRRNRRIGMRKMTEDQWAKLQKDPKLKSIFEAYSRGVNAYIDKLSYDQYPIEFKLLNYAPERWTPTKSCMTYALLSETLSLRESDLENTNMLSLLGREVFDLLYPDQLGNLDPVIPKGTEWEFEPLKVQKPDVEFPLIKTKEVSEKPHPLNGSNNFTVSASKTQNGFPLLANEPDLELTLPSIWYASQLQTPDKNVMGVTVPGTPVILIGFNENVSWGVTNSPRDQVDWYSIEFRDDTREEYLYNNQWFKTKKVVEEISIAGGTTYYDTVVYTHHGPVVYDPNYLPENGKSNYAMKWIAHFPNSTTKAMHDLSSASNYEDFIAAMKKFQGPPQNVLFASNEGDIAIMLPGKFPVKWEEQGKFLMDGSKLSHEWKDYIPFDHFMTDKNPERGFLSSANQHPVDASYPYYVYDGHYEYYRGRRINERLTKMDQITPKDMMKLQNDNYNYMASESLPFMLTALDTTNLTFNESDFFTTLKRWDYFNEPEKIAPTMYQLWWDQLYTNLWDEFDTMTVASEKPNNFVTINYLKTDSTTGFTNLLETNNNENARDLIQLSFKMAVDSLDTWKAENNSTINWSDFKNTKVNHILRLAPFSKENVNIGGYKGIVNAASGNHGPSWRMVVELDPAGTKAWAVYPGSQTGNPGSPLYGHLIDNWASGEYYELLFSDDVSQSNKVIFKQTANPK